MGRRQVLVAAAAVLALPPCARSQPKERPRRIGFLSPTFPGPRNEAFMAGLRKLGYVEERNAIVDMRFAEGRQDRLAELVAELIALEPDVLVVGATIGARAAKAATATIPIVFAGSSDPIAGGIVTSLARPEGNVTGVSLAIGEAFAGKWLEILKDAAPAVSRCAAVWSSNNPAATRFIDELADAARKLSVRLDAYRAIDAAELDRQMTAIRSGPANGLIVTPSPLASANRDKLVQFAASRRLPAMYFDEDFADAGGLMSYGPSVADSYRQAAVYVDRILRGAKPRDLPVAQPTEYIRVLNLRTARDLALDIPQPVLLRFDRVIGSAN